MAVYHVHAIERISLCGCMRYMFLQVANNLKILMNMTEYIHLDDA